MAHYEECKQYIDQYLKDHNDEPKFRVEDLPDIKYIASLQYMRGYADGSMGTLNKITDT